MGRCVLPVPDVVVAFLVLRPSIHDQAWVAVAFPPDRDNPRPVQPEASRARAPGESEEGAERPQERQIRVTLVIARASRRDLRRTYSADGGPSCEGSRLTELDMSLFDLLERVRAARVTA